MQILELDIDAYCGAERDLCDQLRASEDDPSFERELMQVRAAFSDAYSGLQMGSDYEFPYEHFHLRLFWSYLHSDSFYTPDFVPCMRRLLAGQPRSWFAEFECYSPSLESPELPSGYFGQFLIFKETIIFCDNDASSDLRAKLGLQLT